MIIETIVASIIKIALDKIVEKASLHIFKPKSKKIKESKDFQKIADEYKKELLKIKEDIITDITESISPFIDRILDLSKLKSVFEKANTIFQKGATAEEVQMINQELGSIHILEVIQNFTKQLEINIDQMEFSNSIKKINHITDKIVELYDIFHETWNSGAVAKCLQNCNKLEIELISILRYTR